MATTACHRPLKLLYLPKEGDEGDEYGPRSALQALAQSGRLAALETFSFAVEARRRGSAGGAWEEAVARARELQPDLVLFQHIAEFPLPRAVLVQLKALRSQPVIGYHEGDVFGRVFKPFTESMRILASASDVVFAVGLGAYAQRFLTYGARSVCYAPSCLDVGRFGADWEPTRHRRFDVVLIGSRVAPRLRLLRHLPRARMPGAWERENLVRRLGKVFGPRFAVYGQGWDGFVGNRGPIPFARQHEVIREAWLSVGWNHFGRIPYYFSNRLPIALAAGVAHLTNRHPGYEQIFRSGEHLVWAESVEEAVDAARVLLAGGAERAIEMGRRGREFALKSLTAQAVYEAIVTSLEMTWQARLSDAAAVHGGRP